MREDTDMYIQADHLQEDLAQIIFPNGLLLDVGWYRARRDVGMFVISVISYGDWENPKLERETNDVRLLRGIIVECIQVMSELQRGSTG